MRKLEIGKIYRHFKGNLYKVEGTAKHSETGEIFVVYRQMYGEKALWIRPLEMFLEEADHEKYPKTEQRYRFEIVSEDKV